MSERRWTDPSDDRTWWVSLTAGDGADVAATSGGDPTLHFRSETEEHAIACPEAKPLHRFDDDELSRWLERAREQDRGH